MICVRIGCVSVAHTKHKLFLEEHEPPRFVVALVAARQVDPKAVPVEELQSLGRFESLMSGAMPLLV